MVPHPKLHTAATKTNRWSGLTVFGGIALTEYLLLSFCFDAQPVISRGGAWVMFSKMGTVGLIAALAGSAVVLFRFRHAPSAEKAPRRVSHVFLAMHVVIYAMFFALTWISLGRREAPVGSAALWIATWCGVGLLSVASLALGLFGLDFLGSKLFLGPGLTAFLVGLATWEMGQCSQQLWHPLSEATLKSVAVLLRVLFPSAVRGPDGVVLGLLNFTVRVDPVCSGFEGMGLAATLIVVYWITFRRELRFPNALWLLPICVGLAWIGNVVRIVTLMTLGAFVNPQLAVGAFHSKAGWVMFCAITLAVGSLGRRLRFFSSVTNNAGTVDNPTAPFVVPLVILVAVALTTGTFAVTYDRLYCVRLIAAAAALVAFRRCLQGLSWRWSWLPPTAGLLVALCCMVIPVPYANEVQLRIAGKGASVAWTVVRIVGASTIIPICEELAFRGFLLRWIVARDFSEVSFKAMSPFAIVISSLAFGLLHQRWVIATVAGAIYALVQIRSGRLSDAIIAHGVSNAAVAAWVLISGDYAQWVQ